MKKTLLLLLLITFTFACKDKSTTPKTPLPEADEAVDGHLLDAPDALQQVLEAHGGLDQWQAMETLEFSVEVPHGYEITTTDLKDRFALLEMPDHTIGYDGEEVWERVKGKTDPLIDPELYYDQMFRIYALPFLAADEGATYFKVPDLKLGEESYPGIGVSIPTKPGRTARSHYHLYYDPSTYLLEWVGQSDTPSNGHLDFDQLMKYAQWQEVEGLKLPQKIQWFSIVDGQPEEMLKEVEFISPMLTTVKMDDRVYGKPANMEMLP